MSTPNPTPTFRELTTQFDTALVRKWAIEHDLPVSITGGLPRFVYKLFTSATNEPMAGTAVEAQL